MRERLDRLIVPFPSSLRIQGALGLHRFLEQLANAEEYVFDFARLGHCEPLGMLFASVLITEFRKARNSKIFGVNLEHCGYQSHMGFFRALGIDHGNRPGDAEGGVNYLPITHLDVATLQQEADDKRLPVGDIISHRADKMAELLTRASEGEPFLTLSYSLREIMRNVVEHSEARSLQFCLQHWPTRHRVHLAILDTGVGIRKSLSANPYLEIANDSDALKLCVMPGVSGKMYKGKKSDRYDVWENSGYGLYITSRLSSAAGNFWIFSGSGAMGIGAGGPVEFSTSFDGTAIRISMDTHKIGDLGERLKRYAQEGREIAKSFQGASPKGASLASRTIRAHFIE